MPARGVIDLRALDTPPDATLAPSELAAAERTAAEGALALCQTLIRERAEAGTAPRLHLVTRAAVAAGAQHAVEPLQALAWGLARTFAIEHPRLWGGLIDLRPDRSDPEADAAELAAELQSSRTEEQVALRAAGRFGARLVRLRRRLRFGR